MNKTQYLSTLRAIGLSPHSKATALALGVKARQLARYAQGSRINPSVVILLRLYLLYGLTPSDVNKGIDETLATWNNTENS